MLIKTLALSLVAFTASAVADTIVVDNLTKNGAAYASSGVVTGQSFLTGASNLTISYVVVPQLSTSKTNGYSAGESFSVYTDLFNVATGSHSPGIALPGQVFSMANDAGGETTADATTAPILLSNTRYWLMLSTNSAAPTNWNAPDVAAVGYNPSFNSSSGWSLATDNYSAYQMSAGGAVTYFPYASGAQLVYISAVPEPSSVVLLAVASAGAFLIVRRARSAKAA